MSKDTESERLARVETNVEWLVATMAKMEPKMDRIMESHTFFKGKMVGICVVVSAVVGIGIELARAMI